MALSLPYTITRATHRLALLHWPRRLSFLFLSPPHCQIFPPMCGLAAQPVSSGLAPVVLRPRTGSRALPSVTPLQPLSAPAIGPMVEEAGRQVLKRGRKSFPPLRCCRCLSSSPLSRHGLSGLRGGISGHPRRDTRLHHRLCHHYRCCGNCQSGVMIGTQLRGWG